MSVFVADVAIAVVISMSSRATATDVPLAVMSSCISRFAKQLADRDFAAIEVTDIARFDHFVT